MSPKTLYQIYQELIRQHIVKCFRVRETFSLNDYLICHSDQWKWDYQNMPSQMWGLLLEPTFNCYYPLECNDDNYTLLSSQEELKYFRSINAHVVQDIVKQSYKMVPVV